MKLPTLKATEVRPAFSGEKCSLICSHSAKARKKPCMPAANAAWMPSPAANAGIRNSPGRRRGATRWLGRRYSRTPSPHAGQAGAEQRPHPRGPAELTALEQRVDDGDERA